MPRALTFQVAGHLLSLSGDGRREVFERGALTPLPGGEPLLLGLAARHGRAVPVVSLAPLLGGPAAPGLLTLLVEEAGEVLALAVDRVGGVAEEPGPPAGGAPIGEAAPGEPRPLHLSALIRLLREQLTPAAPA